MAQQKPEEQGAIEQVLRLTEKLSPEVREKVMHKLKLEKLANQIQDGIDSGEHGELFPAEDVFAELKQRIADRKKE